MKKERAYPLTKRIKKEIEELALYSIYRMNATYANAYHFYLCKPKDEKRLSFGGGWCNYPYDCATYDNSMDGYFLLEDKKFVKIKK